MIAAWPLRAAALPGFDDVRAAWRPSDTLVLDRHGEPLQRLRTDPTARRGQWVALAEVSPALREAMLRSEDRRFHEHSGVDWRAVSAAAWANLWHQKTRGASTLTMQLAGLLDEDWRHAPGGRSVVAKLGQAVAAERLERSWRKDQILEAWLNLVPLRGELVGIDALSRTLFGKAPHGLDARESAVAAALVRAPNAGAAAVARRACGVLQQTEGRADCEALALFTEGALQRRDFAAGEGLAPHAARQRLRAMAAPGQPLPASVRSTLSGPLQRLAVATLAQQLRELRGRHVQDGAVLVLDNASGEVLAWVGSSGPLSASTEVDHVLAPRQAGSTLKPFLYAQAMAERRLTAASLLDDAPTDLPTSGGLYVPQNYDHRFKGWVSLRTALGASLNVPAVRTLAMVSPDAFHRQLVALGLPLKESGGYYGHSLALGSAEVSLLALTNAYRALANGGRTSPVRLAPGGPSATPGRPVLDARAAWVVGDILGDPYARARTFGTDSVLATRFWTAVKTGTSKDMRDNWAVGWSQRYTVGVWVGNSGGQPMWNVSGTSGAAPVWAALMQALHQHSPSRQPAPPAGLRQVAVAFGPGLAEAARHEWFLDGTEQRWFATDTNATDSIARKPASTRTGGQFQASSSASSSASAAPDARPPTAQAPARITAPAPGTIVALDPDIPPAHQRLRLQASRADVAWRLDGQPLPHASRGGDGAQASTTDGARALWLPWPGKHVISLVDAQGRTLDSIPIEVRGAGLRTAAAPGAVTTTK